MVAFGSKSLLAQDVPSTTSETTPRFRKKIPSPMLASNGKISVGCRSEERADYRWSVLKFTTKTLENFETFFAPVGSTESPLYIEIGTSTDKKDTHLLRRSIRMQWGFSQLVIAIPNPDAVELEVLRVAIVEAFLRETCRTHTGAYENFTWPRWFVRGMTCASFGSVWKANAYEIVLAELEDGTLPTLEAIFTDENLQISDEAAAFFAQWVMQSLSKDERYKQLSTPWTTQDFFGKTPIEAKEKAWRAWIREQEDDVFLPGSITLRHFNRWYEALVKPTSRDEAIRLTDYLTRNSIGRPQLFRDLTVLYLEAYLAWLQEDEAAYTEKRERAEEATKILRDYLTRNPILVDEAMMPTTDTEEW